MEGEIGLNRDPVAIVKHFANDRKKTVNELTQFIAQANASGLSVPDEVIILLDEKRLELEDLTETLADVQVRDNQLQ
ncbi:hypothetical protein GJ688_19555 [Heliobacillus mobilis]|uniref:Uncharacterized protein n=1 Tax=Heliobacterium mobile TaxID=28064 RepID=A0A6I3SPT2_HELMO|nr:hypothetical protein [Heliobacterium mobile]MTV51073.1 hypothetical protein [Heliobacterium mobile]